MAGEKDKKVHLIDALIEYRRLRGPVPSCLLDEEDEYPEGEDGDVRAVEPGLFHCRKCGGDTLDGFILLCDSCKEQETRSTEGSEDE